MSVELESLNCNNCGSPLDVPEVANFVTCNHCDSKLAIRRTTSTTYTEQLNAIENKQDALLRKVELLERTNRVALLDRHWERDQRRYAIRDDNGNERMPTNGAAIGAFLGVPFGVFFTFFAGNIWPPMGVFGVIFVISSVVAGFAAMRKNRDYRTAKRTYNQQRLGLVNGTFSPATFEGLEMIPTPEEYLTKLERSSGA
jgi:DNA-directed RNA polymerase subunit RPC12/RpoP